MRLSTRWSFVLLAMLTMLACTSVNVAQQRTPDGGIIFNESGYGISGEFLTFYQQQGDQALTLFGYPISDVIESPLKPGIQIQYFQRARMELDVTKPAGERITLATLGSWLHGSTQEAPDANIDTSSAACRYFEIGKHPVCFAFLQYYDSHNGAVFFGEPISEVVSVDGRMVQYFEKARMEWWPENGVGMRVVLTDVGTLYLQSQGPVERPKNGIISGKPLRLDVKVFAAKPLIGPSQRQTVYVVVQDQNYAAVGLAAVSLKIALPDGTELVNRQLLTDENGLVTIGDIAVDTFQPDQTVPVNVTVTYPGLDPVSLTTWFRVWW